MSITLTSWSILWITLNWYFVSVPSLRAWFNLSVSLNKYVNGKYIKGIKHIIVLQLFKLVSFNPTHVGVYSLQHYVIKFVSDLMCFAYFWFARRLLRFELYCHISVCEFYCHISVFWGVLIYQWFVYYDVLDHQCIDGHVKCADGIQCIGEWEMCNGDTKCNDESDEIPDVCKGNKQSECLFRPQLCIPTVPV
jgi:hypothetical protein